MKRVLIFVMVGTICSLIGFAFAKFVFTDKNIPILTREKPVERTLDKYSIENLSKTTVKPGKLTLDRENNTFSLEFDPALDGIMASTSGQIRIPGEGKYPLVVMIRGYVDKEIFKTGIGTEPSSKVFAAYGYITVAPDFLGYGSSSPESLDLFEARMQTYTTVLSLLASVDQIPEWDGKNILIWAHSNGGQIALTTLEITGKSYPTTLWAPVSAGIQDRPGGSGCHDHPATGRNTSLQSTRGLTGGCGCCKDTRHITDCYASSRSKPADHSSDRSHL